MEEEAQLEINAAKLEGLEAIRIAVNKWNHNENLHWDLLAINKGIANKLLQSRYRN
ncbi:hypothetical protein [Cellulophaga sp. L1A9]|uniref:hypothetical protein n=1 Tax=Cellulophaga sp. L1A9 TaxID=2686362 RepID=UPI00131DB8F0|nr:hypothetical protein [Cellulophaga sp. L1A9]